MSKNKKELNFQKKINCSEFIQLSLNENEIREQIIEFIWFFNGTNNVNFLLDNNNYNFIDLLYKKYFDEIEKLIKYYDLAEIIEETESFHGWFRNWKNLEKFNKEEFVGKLKTDVEFSSVWADFGISDSLEFRNWGIQISFDTNDNGVVSQKGKDQFKQLINSLSQNPENGFHIINYYNISNIEERLTKNDLILNKFFCEPMSYEERVKWFFHNYYETGMELPILMESFKKENLDFVKWYDSNVSIPKYKLNIIADYNTIDSDENLEKKILFNYLFISYISKLFNMIPNKIYINSLYRFKGKSNKKNLLILNYKIKIGKKDFQSLSLDINDFLLFKL